MAEELGLDTQGLGGISAPTAPPTEWTHLRAYEGDGNPKWLNPISAGLPFSREGRWEVTPTAADLVAMRERMSGGVAVGTLDVEGSSILRPMVLDPAPDKVEPLRAGTDWASWGWMAGAGLACVLVGVLVGRWWRGRGATA